MPDRDAHYLTSEDVRILKALRNRVNTNPLNTSSGGGAGRPPVVIDSPYIDSPAAPEIYVAKTSQGGIPAIFLTGNSDPDQPGVATCDVYRIDFDMTLQAPALTQIEGLSQRVHNLSETAVPEFTWVLVLRDKFGTWLTFGVGATTEVTGTDGTSTVATDVCGDYKTVCVNGYLLRYRCNEEGEYEFDGDLRVPCDVGCSDTGTGTGTFDPDCEKSPLILDLPTKVCPVYGPCREVNANSAIDDFLVGTEDWIISIDATDGDVTLTVVDWLAGQEFLFVRTDGSANVVTVDMGGGTVNGQLDFTIDNQYESVWVVGLCAEGTWVVAGHHGFGTNPTGTGHTI